MAQVYLELLGGREPSLLLDKKNNIAEKNKASVVTLQMDSIQRKYREPRSFALSEDIELKHREFWHSKNFQRFIDFSTSFLAILTRIFDVTFIIPVTQKDSP